MVSDFYSTDQTNPPIQPGKEQAMQEEPQYLADWYKGSGKLKNKTVIITGGDSGIGKSTAILAGREGANVVIVYLNEHRDAEEAKQLVENEGAKCLLMAGDLQKPEFATLIVEETLRKFNSIDVLINNAGGQVTQDSLIDISNEQMETTFRTNIFSMFYLTKAVLLHLKKGSCIINTTSVTAYRGSEHLIDYASTKGAILAFTRSLALSLASKGIRVNAVAPGPIWTPLITSSFSQKEQQEFGKDTALGRAGQPEEVAPCFIFLASQDSSFMTGQVLHPNGGEIINT